MSWDAYVTNLIGDGSVVSEAALWGRTSGQEAQWATSGGLNLTVDEVKKLVSDRGNFRISGCHVAGKKCMLITDNLDEDGNNTMNLKTSKDEQGNSYSIVVGMTKQALIIAMGKKDVGVGQVNPIVHKMVTYLRGNNM